MNLNKYIVVSGFSGVHKLVASRSNGVLFEDILLKRVRFAPSRGGSFTALGTVSVYAEVEDGTVPLSNVFTLMNDKLEEHPLVDGKANSAAQRAYFKAVFPEHDEDQVHINDIKKIVKWFSFMKTNGLIDEAIATAKKEAEKEAEKATETAAETEVSIEEVQ